MESASRLCAQSRSDLVEDLLIAVGNTSIVERCTEPRLDRLDPLRMLLVVALKRDIFNQIRHEANAARLGAA